MIKLDWNDWMDENTLWVLNKAKTGGDYRTIRFFKDKETGMDYIKEHYPEYSIAVDLGSVVRYENENVESGSAPQMYLETEFFTVRNP